MNKRAIPVLKEPDTPPYALKLKGKDNVDVFVLKTFKDAKDFKQFFNYDFDG